MSGRNNRYRPSHYNPNHNAPVYTAPDGYTPIPNISSYLIRGTSGARGNNNNNNNNGPFNPRRYAHAANDPVGNDQSRRSTAAASQPAPTRGDHDHLFRLEPNRAPSDRPPLAGRRLTREDFRKIVHPSPPPSPPLRPWRGYDDGNRRPPPPGGAGQSGDKNAAPPPPPGADGGSGSGGRNGNANGNSNGNANARPTADRPRRNCAILFIGPVTTRRAIIGVLVEFALAAVRFSIGDGRAGYGDVVTPGLQALGVVIDVCFNGNFYVVSSTVLPIGVGGYLREFWAVWYWLKTAVRLMMWMWGTVF